MASYARPERTQYRNLSSSDDMVRENRRLDPHEAPLRGPDPIVEPKLGWLLGLLALAGLLCILSGVLLALGWLSWMIPLCWDRRL